MFHLSVLVIPLHRVFLGNIGLFFRGVLSDIAYYRSLYNMNLCHCAIVGLSVLCYTKRLPLCVVLSVYPSALGHVTHVDFVRFILTNVHCYILCVMNIGPDNERHLSNYPVSFFISKFYKILFVPGVNNVFYLLCIVLLPWCM